MNICDVEIQSAMAATMPEDELATFWFNLYDQAVGVAKGHEVVNRDLSERLNRAVARHERDIERISDALIKEANNRGWCNEYDMFIYTLNGDLSFPMKIRTKTYRIWKRFIVEVSETVEAPIDEIKDIASSRDLTDWMDVSDFDEYDEEDYGFEEV